MFENEKPVPPSPVPAAHAAGPVPFAKELDRARWTMPAALSILIAIVAVAIVVTLVAFFNRSTPSAAGTITRVAAAPQGEGVMVAIQIKFDNMTASQLWIKSIKSELETADGQKYSDDAAAAADLDRYLQAFPVLAEQRTGPLKEEMKIPPKGALAGMIIVSFPVSKDAFDARKSLSVQMGFYDHPGMVIKQ
jgi:hypothetical protein